MKGILGIKLGMTQVIDDGGVSTAVTIVQAGPCFVTQVKTDETDKYSAVQIGFEEVKPKSLTKGQLGHLGQLEASKKHPDKSRKVLDGVPPVRHLREFRTDDPVGYELGQVLTVEQFEPGDKVDVTGQSKGKGFAGVVKRHHFAGGPKTHGQSDRHRAPGSIGATSTTARVFKGTRMAGRMGNERKTVQNLEIMRIDVEKNLLAIKGPVPGAKGSLIMIRNAIKG